MLRFSSSLVGSSSRRRKFLLASSSAVVLVGGTTSAAYYTNQHPHAFVGLQRQGTFWIRVIPVVWDYYWNFAESSPYVKYQERKARSELTGAASTHGTANADQSATSLQEQRDHLRSIKLQATHEKHALTILQVMLDLKGLFVKLGQVLSVTALPLPEPYRIAFRALQDQVANPEDFATIASILEHEFQRPWQEVFETFEETPVGAASIGQAHCATLKSTGEQVIVKVVSLTTKQLDAMALSHVSFLSIFHSIFVQIQYPDASWQVPADIASVGDFMKLCVRAGVLDDDAARLSFDEFSRQFINELDYDAERSNLQTIYESSLDPSAPYRKRNIVVPRVLSKYCTSKVITMTYLPGTKLEDEARKQLAMLGIDMSKRNIGDLVRSTARESTSDVVSDDKVSSVSKEKTQGLFARNSLLSSVSQLVGRAVGLDAILFTIRLARRLLLWSTALTVSAIHFAAPVAPATWTEWAALHQMDAQQAERLSLTASWIDGLFDVHGHQIFSLGLFNADPHPGVSKFLVANAYVIHGLNKVFDPLIVSRFSFPYTEHTSLGPGLQ
jgi:hypothetical protein